MAAMPEVKVVVLESEEILGRLTNIERMVELLVRRSGIEMKMEVNNMINLDNITREVAETKGAVESMMVAWKAAVDKVRETAQQVNDADAQTKIEALANELEAIQNDIAQAVGHEPGGSIGGAQPSE